jgi:DNA-binding Lrp family transcriptional regulator
MTTDDIKELYEERAAILEHDAGIVRLLAQERAVYDLAKALKLSATEIRRRIKNE